MQHNDFNKEAKARIKKKKQNQSINTLWALAIVHDVRFFQVLGTKNWSGALSDLDAEVA